MKAMIWRWALAAAALHGGIGCVGAQPHGRPSFDCRKASNPTEKSICANDELAKLDRDLASLWRGIIHSFTDDGQLAEIKVDQKRWIARRDECGERADCIANHYREEIDRFNGKDKEYPVAGVFEVKDIGDAALYPHDGGYLVSIHTADPKSGSWTCEVNGTATADGAGLRVISGDETFAADAKGPDILLVTPSPEVRAVASKNCGLNGTFAFTYTRQGQKEKH